MKKIKYLFLIMILTFMSSPFVKAEQNWAQYVTNYPSQLYFRNCSGSDCNVNGSVIGSNQFHFNFSGNGNSYYYNESNKINISANGNGAMVIFGFTPVIPNNLYSLTAYMCSNMSLSTTNIKYDYYFGSEWTETASRVEPTVNKAYFTGTEIDNIPFVNPTNETNVRFNHCYSRTFIFDPIKESRFIGISLKGNGVSSSGKIAFIGYDLEYLGSSGLSSSDISHIVKNSGLATATSIEEVNQSIDEVKQELNNVSNSVDNVNDSITNNNVEGVEGSFESFEGFIAENSTITQLITMPITLYTSILNGMQSTCKPFNLGILFGTNLSIPCINIGNYLGSSLWAMIDIIISGFAIFSISKKFIKIFNNFSSMKEGDVIDD